MKYISLTTPGVSLNSDNSAAIVMRHYFDTVEKSAARAYFDIRPISGSDRKIVALAS
jgi:hypothetical protein